MSMFGFEASRASREPKLAHRGSHKEKVGKQSRQVVEGREYHLCLMCDTDIQVEF